jgi:hypothetical protein
MARRYARIKVTIWGDRDFRNLSSAAQRLYLLLASSPEINLCGVTDWRPARIAKLASDTSAQDIEEAGAELVNSGYIVLTDDETEEALVRSFVRHDEGIKTPNIAAAVAKDYSAVYSDNLRGVIVHELHRLKEDEPDWKGWGAVRKVLGDPSVNPSGMKVSGKGSAKVSGNPSPNASDIPQPSTLYRSPQPKRVPRKRSTRLPEGWTPSDDMVAQMRTECPNVNQQSEYRKFVDYWRAQPGQKGVKADWEATYRNWIRKAAEYQPNNNKGDIDDLLGRAAQRMGIAQ